MVSNEVSDEELEHLIERKDVGEAWEILKRRKMEMILSNCIWDEKKKEAARFLLCDMYDEIYGIKEKWLNIFRTMVEETGEKDTACVATFMRENNVAYDRDKIQCPDYDYYKDNILREMNKERLNYKDDLILTYIVWLIINIKDVEGLLREKVLKILECDSYRFECDTRTIEDIKKRICTHED
jgi:hypothetical protein